MLPHTDNLVLTNDTEYETIDVNIVCERFNAKSDNSTKHAPSSPTSKGLCVVMYNLWSFLSMEGQYGPWQTKEIRDFFSIPKTSLSEKCIEPQLLVNVDELCFNIQLSVWHVWFSSLCICLHQLDVTHLRILLRMNGIGIRQGNKNCFLCGSGILLQMSNAAYKTGIHLDFQLYFNFTTHVSTFKPNLALNSIVIYF